MKILFYILCFLLGLTGCLLLPKKITVCGEITERYITSEKHATHNVVLYSEDLQKFVHVYVTPTTYANTKIGKRACFDMHKHQLK